MKRRAFIAGSGALAAGVFSSTENSLMAAAISKEPQKMPSSIKPPKLRKGDTVGIVSPAWGGAGLFSHRVELGVRQLEKLGYKVKIGKHALNHKWDHISDTAKNRAADIHEMFLDPNIKAVVAAIGGNHSSHLLPLLDFDLIRSHPKIFMGYSDITVLNVAIWKMTGLVTFNGPALLTDFAEYPRMYEYTLDSMLRALTQSEPIGSIDPADRWTDEFLDWAEKLDLTRPRIRNPSPGWTWLKPGLAEGKLIGGTLSSLQHLRGTPYWPDWEDSILFIETAEDVPSPATVDGTFMAYENMGVLSQIKGLLVGRSIGYGEKEKEQLRDVYLERTQKFDFPVITDMDFGHTAPQFTLPIGCRARIDSEKKRFEILEAAVTG